MMDEVIVDVVDDNAAYRKLMQILLTDAGFQPRTHRRAEDLLEAARREPPAMIVADVQLPGGMDGLSLTRALRATPETAHVPVLVVSAFASPRDEADARRAGCDAWLPKPLDTREFVSLCRWLLVPDHAHDEQ